MTDGTAAPASAVPEQMTTSDVAACLGVTAATVRSYAARGILPPPDGHLGRTPWWTPATIQTWKAGRPGQGKGGGRPPKELEVPTQSGASMKHPRKSAQRVTEVERIVADMDEGRHYRYAAGIEPRFAQMLVDGDYVEVRSEGQHPTGGPAHRMYGTEKLRDLLCSWGIGDSARPSPVPSDLQAGSA